MREMTNEPKIVNGANGGSHVSDGPLTTTAIREASPDLLLSEIDQRVVKVRPMATPVDQISRMVGARKAKSMVVEYYSVDSKAVVARSKNIVQSDDNDIDGMTTYLLKTDNDSIFSATETILAPTVSGQDANGNDTGKLLMYVLDKTDAGLKVVMVNASGNTAATINSLNAGKRLVRMGRAAAELDVQTPQFEALPKKASNYCQIFKAQIEQSTYAKLSAKEVGWGFSDQEEVAIMDMRMGMEKNFLFGSKARITDPRKMDEVLFTQGIWEQAGSEEELDVANLTMEDLVRVMRTAFTGDASGSNKKVFIGGSALIEAINNLEYTRVVGASQTTTRWGIDFQEIRSKFGTLYVVHAEIFDQCGLEDCGMIIDPEYMTKYVHVPFKVEHLDLKKSGVRNVDALVVTEASCLVLRHPKAHVRIVPA
ncbi:MAG: DUF5309 domain-containing protein [Paramuribaculum sp.]|nr:DUF5309 domain-containing protein [Paramuribaculum sp.]